MAPVASAPDGEVAFVEALDPAVPVSAPAAPAALAVRFAASAAVAVALAAPVFIRARWPGEGCRHARHCQRCRDLSKSCHVGTPNPRPSRHESFNAPVPASMTAALERV